MHKFHIPSENISADKIIISDKGRVRHIKDVLRLKPKDKVILFDERANEYTADIEKVSSGGISLKVKEKSVSTASSKFRLTVACAIPKKAKMDDIIDKLTQLGVDRIIPLKTGRTVVKIDKHKEAGRKARWEKIAVNAAQQSQRPGLPVIDPIKDIKEILEESRDFDLKLIPTLAGKRRFLKEIFAKACPRNILVLIGPEGDFTPQEVAAALKTGFIPVTLGKLVLRVDTAAVTVTSFIRLYENG
jgi:16S rRNA (uracil1498-N3)-methyltransferase